MDELVNWCMDIPDNRNYSYSEIAWANIELPTSCIIDDINDYQNQGLEDITAYMCVAYSTTHWVNILNNIEKFWEWDYNAKEFGLKMVELWRLDTKAGAYIIDWPKTAKELGRIAWYFQVRTIDEVKQAIVNWHPVVTWSNQLIWGNICKAWKNEGHCILAIWYNEIGLIIKQSYWINKRNKWTNLLPYELFDKLFYTKLALIDSPNTILQYKQQIMNNITNWVAKIAYEKKAWNWENPTKQITTEEAVAIIYQNREYLENKLNYIEERQNKIIETLADLVKKLDDNLK